MKKWLVFCLTLLISITLVACGSNDKNDNEEVNNNDNTNTNTEEQSDINSDENENNADANTNIEENENEVADADTNANSGTYDFDPTGENVVTLELEQNGVTMKLTYKADGDKVFEQTADNEMPYASLGVTTAEEAEEVLAPVVLAYQETEGVTHSMDYQEDRAFESLTINYDEADINEVSALTGSTFEGDLSEGISLKRSVDLLLEQGFQIVE